MKKIYDRPTVLLVEIRAERGFAASSTWDDTMNGTDDIWIGKGNTDDEWA